MDINRMDDLLHPDYAIIQPGGKVETKKDVLDSYKSGERHWRKAFVDEIDVQIYGNMARVLGIWNAEGANRGSPFHYKARFVSVWVKVNDSWKNIAYASAAIGD